MTAIQPQQFSYLYAHDKAIGKSLDETVDLSTCTGHVMRCSQTKKFLYFDDIIQLNNYFVSQTKPYLHSVINMYRPVRFNLELDMPTNLLDNIIFPKAILVKIEQESVDLNLIKSLKCLEHVQEVAYDILEEYGVEMSEYKFLTASDNRKEKFSYRMYLKLAFENMSEYKHFIKLLKEKVRPEVLPMIDSTSLMLRTPGSYKDTHVAKWMTPCAIEDSILSYTNNCDLIEPQAPEKDQEQKFDELTVGVTNKAVALIATHPLIQGNYYYTRENKGLLCLKRIQPSHCVICDRTHDASDAYVTISRDNVHLRCYRDDTKGSVFLGFIGEAEPMKFRWSDVKTIMKAQDKLKETGMSNKEKTEMAKEQKTLFEEAKKAALENEAALSVEKFYYSDFNMFHKKTFMNDAVFYNYVKTTIAKIVQGGNCLFITSDWWKDHLHYTELSSLPCSAITESYWYEIINLDFDESEPVDKRNQMVVRRYFKDKINEYTMEHFYKTVDFVPYLIPPANQNKEIFNMFEGFRFPYVEAKVDPCVQPWIDHIFNVVCCGNADQAKVLTQWMAHIVQKPTSKAFAVILYGKQGTGKSILYDFFTRCIGQDLGLQLSKLEDLTQTHNTHVRGKMIVNCNECTNQPAIRDVNILKGMITETELIINPKNVNQYKVSNYSRILITSNYKECMRLDADDRRYFCLKISDVKKGNKEYFAPLVASLKDDYIQKEFFNYLANFDISDFGCQSPPMSSMKRDMIGLNIPNLVSFVQDICENNVCGLEYPETEVEIVPTIDDVYRSYNEWCRDNDAKGSRMNKTQLTDRMGETLGVRVCRPRVNGKRIRKFNINRAELLDVFKKQFQKDDFEYVIS